MATTKQKLYKNITILSFITFFLSFAIAIACLCWQKYSIAIYFLCSSIACIIVSFFTLLRSPLTSSKLAANGSERQRHTTKINWFVYNLNSAVFFLVRKFYMLRCLFGTLYVDMRCFGVSCFFSKHKIPHPNQWGILKPQRNTVYSRKTSE